MVLVVFVFSVEESHVERLSDGNSEGKNHDEHLPSDPEFAIIRDNRDIASRRWSGDGSEIYVLSFSTSANTHAHVCSF